MTILKKVTQWLLINFKFKIDAFLYKNDKKYINIGIYIV